MRPISRITTVFVAVLISQLLPPMAQAGVDRLGGCGQVFSLPSVGLEGQIRRSTSSGSITTVTLALLNVSDESTAVPVGEDSGIWQLETESGDRKAYDLEASTVATQRLNNQQSSIPVNGVRLVELHFQIVAEGNFLLFNGELGGSVQREGVEVCGLERYEPSKPTGEDIGSEQSASVDGTPGTGLPTSIDPPQPTATATRVPPTATAVSVNRAATLTTILLNSSWLPNDFPGLSAPNVALIDGGPSMASSCIEASGTWGSSVFYIFDSAEAAQQEYFGLNAVEVRLYSGASALTVDAGTANLTFVLYESVIILGFAQSGVFVQGQFYDSYTVSLELADRGLAHVVRVT